MPVPETMISGTPAVADLFGDIAPQTTPGWTKILPGLTLTVLATMAAAFVGDRYGAPVTLMALLLGLSLNFLGEDERVAAGLDFASRTLLRLGIVLLGARVTWGQIADLGPEALLAIALILAVTLGSGIVVSRLLGLDAKFGTLAGGAVAICGASAAMAIATVLGDRRTMQSQLALVLVGISAASATAMLAYPLLAHRLGFNDDQAGFMLGAAIHDVAQAVGAGYSFSDGAGQVATIAKLTRVAMLAPVLAIISFAVRKPGVAKSTMVPWFVIGFFALAGVNSIGLLPAGIGEGAQLLASALLACAIAATGIRAPIRTLLTTGVRPMLVIAAASLVALLGSGIAATMLL